MPTCPNCGEIVMNGDPYCPHCGATFRWVEDEYEMRASKPSGRPSLEMRILNVPIGLFYSRLDDLHEPGYIIAGLKKSIDFSKAPAGTTVNIGQPYPEGDIDITFIRKNKYFSTADSLRYRADIVRLDGYYFRSDFRNLKDAEWFKRAVRQKETETGLKFYDCGGGYDARYDWDRNTFELKKGCEVIAHFIESEYSYRGFPVDFKNRRLKSESKTYDRTPPAQIVYDYDWY